MEIIFLTYGISSPALHPMCPQKLQSSPDQFLAS